MGRLSWEATRGLPYDATPDVSQSIAVRGDSEPVIGQVYGRCGVWGYPAFGRLVVCLVISALFRERDRGGWAGVRLAFVPVSGVRSGATVRVAHQVPCERTGRGKVGQVVGAQGS